MSAPALVGNVWPNRAPSLFSPAASLPKHSPPLVIVCLRRPRFLPSFLCLPLHPLPPHQTRLPSFDTAERPEHHPDGVWAAPVGGPVPPPAVREAYGH